MATIDAVSVTRLERPAAAYAWYVLAILFVANCFNAMDRSILSILIEPVKKDLGLNDTEVGVIAGLGYAVVYALVGFATARIVDRGNRTRLLAAGIAAWSVMTALTGMTMGFWSMLAARLGIAAGEATCYPNALSLISDYFDRAKRSRAIAIFQLGTYGGIIFGIATASVIASAYGWRAAFYLLGLPGLVLAAVVWFTVREPARGTFEADGGAAARAPAPAYGGMRMMLSLVATNRRFAVLTACSITMAMAQVIMGLWVPAALMRLHDVTQQQVGLSAVPFIGLSGVIGTVVGGFLGTRIAERNPSERAPLLVMLWSAPLAIPALLFFLFAPTFFLAVVGGVFSVFFIAMHFGPLVAVIIGSVNASVRGLATSLLTMSQFLIGLGLGPLTVGALSDLLTPAFGTTAIRYAMLVAPVAVLVSWLLCLIGYRAFRSSLAAS